MSAATRTSLTCWAVVPAAGSGRRMEVEVPKQYLPLYGSTVLEHSLNALFSCEAVEGVVLALAPGDAWWPEIAPRFAGKNLACVPGGEERCHSVLSALRHLRGFAGERDWVLVHDAARPCVRIEDIKRLIETVGDDPCGGLLAVPVSDTMKRSGADGRILETVDRQALWHAQTPQMFRLGLLQAALEQALAQGAVVTDESSAVEMAGNRPCLVRGRADNIKITVPSDLGLAEFYFRERGEP